MRKIGTNYLFAKSFKENWNRPALSDYEGKTLYYKDLASEIARLHILFNELNVKRGDSIALCGKNSANWGVIFLASISYGAVIVPILHEFKPDNIHYVVNHSDAKLLFVSRSIWENLNEESMPELDGIFTISDMSPVYLKKGKKTNLQEKIAFVFRKKYRNAFRPDDISYYNDKPMDLAVISYTSGTTGISKGVMLPFRSLFSNILFAQDVLPEFGNKCRLVSMLPMAHMYGLMFEFLFEMSVGAHVHFLTRLPTPKIIIEAFANIRPNLVISVPLIIEKIYRKQLQPILEKTSVKMLLKLPVIDRVILGKVLSKLNTTFGEEFIEIIVGGASFNREAEQFFKKIGFRYTVGYGMTECGPIITYSQWDSAALYSCGKVVARMQIRIDSPDPANMSGEIHVRGDNVFLGYYKNKEATKASFTKDGWFKTGDMGVIDKRGYLYIKGRCKNMILGPSGQNIYPEEIEDVINSKQYVAESLVVEQGGKLVALVYPDLDAAGIDGVTEADIPKVVDAILKEVNEELPKYAQISSIQVRVEEFEKTPKKSIKRFLYQLQ